LGGNLHRRINHLGDGLSHSNLEGTLGLTQITESNRGNNLVTLYGST